MGNFNPRAPDIAGSEFQPTVARRVTLNSPLAGVAQRVRPGAVTLTRLHPLLTAVEGNPGLAMEVLTTLTPTITESTFFPGTDTSKVTTGWQDSAAGAVNYTDVDVEYNDETNYATNASALSVAGALDLQFRGNDAGALGTDRVLHVAVGTEVKLRDFAGNPSSVPIYARLVINGTGYISAPSYTVKRTTFAHKLLNTWHLNPETGLPWTTAEADDLLDAADPDTFGIRVQGKLIANGLRVAGYWAKIAHCAENRIGSVYKGDAPRTGWLEKVLTGTSACSANTFYWVHLFALNGSTSDWLQVGMVKDPALVLDAYGTDAGEGRMLVQTTLSGRGGVPVAVDEHPGQMWAVLLETGAGIHAESQPWSELTEIAIDSSTSGLHIGQQVTTPNPTSTFGSVQLAAEWIDPNRRPDQPLQVEVRTGAGASTGGGTLKATGVLHPEDTVAHHGKYVLPFAAPFAAAVSTQHHLLVMSDATPGRGWKLSVCDSRSDLVTAGGATSVAEVEGASQGGQTDSFEVSGVANDRADLPVALVASAGGGGSGGGGGGGAGGEVPAAPTGFGAVAFAGVAADRPPGVYCYWSPTSLAAGFGAYRVYRRPTRAIAQPWHLVAEIAPRAVDTATHIEEHHTAWTDTEAGWATRMASTGRAAGPYDDGWDYAVTVVDGTNGLESSPSDASVTGITVTAARVVWLTSNAAPWLSTPLETAGRLTSEATNRTRVYEVAGRDDAVTRTRAERPVRRWRLGWRHLGWRSEDAARWQTAASLSGRQFSLLTSRGDLACGVLGPPAFSHDTQPVLPTDADLVVTANTPALAGYNVAPGVILDGVDDRMLVDDHPDLDPGDDGFTVIACGTAMGTDPSAAVVTKGLTPSDLIYTAALRLSAGSVDPDTYQPGDPWPNLGTLGNAYNATVPTSGTVATPTLIPTGTTNGPGFQVGTGGSSSSAFGWEIPHNAAFDIPNTGGVTFTLDITPINAADPSYKLMQKYPAADLPTSGEGWGIEHTDIYGGLLTAAFDGVNWGAIIIPTNVSTRHRLTFRWDRTTNELTCFRNGVEVGTRSDISTLGDVTTTAKVKIGQDNIYHNVLIHNTPLSDADIAELHAAMAPDGTGWAIFTTPGGDLQWAVNGQSALSIITSTGAWDATNVVGVDSDGTTLRLFHDGTLDTTGTWPAHGTVANLMPIVVGAIIDPGPVFASFMALNFQAVAYYPRVLTADEHAAAAHWLLGHHGYRMPGGAAVFVDIRDDRCWDGIATVFSDLTGNRHDLTAYGNPTLRGIPWRLSDLDRTETS